MERSVRLGHRFRCQGIVQIAQQQPHAQTFQQGRRHLGIPLQHLVGNQGKWHSALLHRIIYFSIARRKRVHKGERDCADLFDCRAGASVKGASLHPPAGPRRLPHRPGGPSAAAKSAVPDPGRPYGGGRPGLRPYPRSVCPVPRGVAGVRRAGLFRRGGRF